MTLLPQFLPCSYPHQSPTPGVPTPTARQGTGRGQAAALKGRQEHLCSAAQAQSTPFGARGQRTGPSTTELLSSTAELSTSGGGGGTAQLCLLLPSLSTAPDYLARHQGQAATIRAHHLQGSLALGAAANPAQPLKAWEEARLGTQAQGQQGQERALQLLTAKMSAQKAPRSPTEDLSGLASRARNFTTSGQEWGSTALNTSPALQFSLQQDQHRKSRRQDPPCTSSG